jgi:hypothetical protein
MKSGTEPGVLTGPPNTGKYKTPPPPLRPKTKERYLKGKRKVKKDSSISAWMRYRRRRIFRSS